MYELTTAGKVFQGVLCTYAACIIGFWLYLVFSMALSFGSSSTLLQKVRKVSKEKWDDLHEGSINSALGRVPNLTVNQARYSQFVDSDEMNEYPEIQKAKVECQRWGHRLRKGLVIWFCLIALGLLIIVTAIVLATQDVIRLQYRR